jgi:hypothetical protein
MAEEETVMDTADETATETIEDGAAETNDVTDAETQPSGESGENADGAKPAEDAQQDGIDPELLRYATGKGYAEDFLKNEHGAKSVKAQREMERHMGKLQAEVDRYKKLDLDRAEQTLKAEPEKSPVDTVEETWAERAQMAAQWNGCADVNEFRAKFPDAYNRMAADYTREHNQALAKMAAWEYDRRAGETRKTESQQKIEAEKTRIKELASANKAAARQKDKEFDKKMLQSGMVPWIQRLAKATGAPEDAYYADKQTFDLLSKAADAIVRLQDGDIEKKARQEVEKNIKKTKDAEPVGDMPLPDDFNVFARAQGAGKVRLPY